jgi:Mrp family chromosome partitioning ATPase
VDATRPVSSTISDYLGMLRRHWWIILTVAVLGVAGAAALTVREPRVYESSTSVLVHAAGGADANVVGGRTRGDINLDTEAQLVRSTAVAVEAAKLLRVDTAPDALARRVAVEVPANTSVLLIQYRAGTPRAAQAGSHAFAEAYLRNRESSAKADLAAQTSTLDIKIRQLSTSVAQINARLARTDKDSLERENLQSQRETALTQINTLAGRLNQLVTATVSAGKIISDARLPVQPIKPSVPLNLATGLMVGLLGGLGAAAGRERLDRRVRAAVDMQRRSGVPVLADLPARVTPRFDDVFPPYGTGGRTFNRLRNEILASLGPDDQVVVVTGASRGPGATLVAANLAAALARTGSEVVLVCAHLPDTMIETASATRMLGVGALPGLSDVLAGRVAIADALQRAPRNPWLRVITTGGTATAAGLLQSQNLRDTLATLRAQAEYVVVEAPSTAASADAQSLAGLADAAIVVVETRRTVHAEVADAAEQLHRIGTPLLGAVVLPRLRPSADEPPAPPMPGRPELSLDAPAAHTVSAASTVDPEPDVAPSAKAGIDVGLSTSNPGQDIRVDRPTSTSSGQRRTATGRRAGHNGAHPGAHNGASPDPRRPGDDATIVLKRLDPATLEALDRANGRPAEPAADDGAER